MQSKQINQHPLISCKRPCLALLTDFGLAEPYVCQLKAVLLSYCPRVQIVDISHDVPPFNIRVGAYFLAASEHYFPAHSLFICVVDPGVGGDRDIIILKANNKVFIAPNNGLLSLIKQDSDAQLWRFLPPKNKLESAVFAGRDTIASVAGKLIAGRSPKKYVEPCSMDSFFIPQWSNASIFNGKIKANILHIDNFGNVILNITYKQWELLRPGKALLMQIGAQEFPIFPVDYYSQLPDKTFVILHGSQGYMEIAMVKSSAAAALGLSALSTGLPTTGADAVEINILL